MNLYGSTTSPFVRKVLVMAAEKRLDDRIRFIPVSVGDNPPELLAANPLGKVPALVTDDGAAFYDSPVICEYLDSIGEGRRLAPESGIERWTVLRRAALGDGVMDATVSIVIERRREAAQQSPLWLARWENAIRRGVAEMASESSGLSREFGYDQIVWGAALGYLDFRLPDIDWRADHPDLAEWFAHADARPSMASTRLKA